MPRDPDQRDEADAEHGGDHVDQQHRLQAEGRIERRCHCGREQHRAGLQAGVEAVDPHELVGRDDLGDEGADGRRLDAGPDRPDRQGDVHRPQVVDAGHQHRHEPEGGDGDDGVRADDEQPSVVAIRPDPAEDGEHGLWQEPRDRREHEHHARAGRERQVPEDGVLDER
jgi:hypothetical protein